MAAAGVKAIQIVVKTSNGKAFAVTIAQTESVTNLRTKLSGALKPPATHELQLVFSGKAMSLGTLADYGVVQDSTINANFVPVGTGNTVAAPASVVPNPLSPVASAAPAVASGAAAAAAAGAAAAALPSASTPLHANSAPLAVSAAGQAATAAVNALPPAVAAASKQKNLTGVAVIEKDVNSDLFAWTFPLVDADTLEFIRARCGLRDSVLSDPAFRYAKFRTNWVYSLHAPVDPNRHAKVTGVSVVVLSEVFNPSKFEALTTLLWRMWLGSGHTTPPVLAAYLNAFTTGRVQMPATVATAAANALGGGGAAALKDPAALSYNDADFDNRRAFISPVREVFQLFGGDAMLIWTAVLLRKRVFVYSDKVADLLALIRSFPLLGGWHRQNWDLLRPVMGVSGAELADLAAAGVYVAGFTDPTCAQHKQLYDLYVDVPARAFTVAEHAKADFALTPFHRDLGDAFLAAAEKQTDQAVIKEIALKTKELITNIASLKAVQPDGQAYVTFADLTARKLPAGVDRFLYAVALAEGLTKK